MQRALRGEASSDVACGYCTACCTSSQFVHIGPEEASTLAHIPSELLFAAPRLPKGHLVLGYDQRLPDPETEREVLLLGVAVVTMPWYPGKEDARTARCG